MAKKNEVEKRENTNSDSRKSTEQILIENFVSLQKVMTNLAVKFDGLSGQISKLLDLFEISAKTLAEKDYSVGEKSDKKVAEKLDNILEQNKIIAKGITMLHESNIPEEQYPAQNMQRNFPSQPQAKMNPETYQKKPVQNFQRTSGFQNRTDA